ncbi:hypothetical protein POX_b02535 [Penicillium oxalicum]|uniref:hypothetical protein n=1 Tax=Penicillium oxalicum TaxID=69781 RepID=UPI0020B8D982|nr:hypothetical protein POX_b02535 [Penicillium oxalicum]KAI2792497.1 hypothetical protein POX_b02535 [Penicillium oxalicum]
MFVRGDNPKKPLQDKETASRRVSRGSAHVPCTHNSVSVLVPGTGRVGPESRNRQENGGPSPGVGGLLPKERLRAAADPSKVDT